MGICYSNYKINFQQQIPIYITKRNGLVFTGQHRSGQTAICNQIINGTFYSKHNEEIICNKTLINEHVINIVDIAGFKKISIIEESIQYFQQCKYAIIVFSMNQNYWQEQIDNRIKFITRIDNEIEIILIANKIDLFSGDLTEFELYSKESGYPLIYCSAKTGEGIDKIKIKCGLTNNEILENSQ
ncbi:Rab-like_protein [Hexamita inflata]|uniref:Rab-like protein n=1 Tax=Hexamita inflata TaxID=28002 RepID=A0AA86VQ86_9EUKA|nr:Rab-like protein [Hexamita inflata]